MTPELKEKLTKFAEATLREMEVGKDKVTLEVMLRKTQLPVAKNARILAPRNVRRRVMNARLWQQASEEICLEWLSELLVSILRKQKVADTKVQISAAKEKQLSLFSGFERLPTRIRRGDKFLDFSTLSVPHFIDYKRRYWERAQKDQQTAEELQRLAVQVAPFTDTDLTVAAAYERATFQREGTPLKLVK